MDAVAFPPRQKRYFFLLVAAFEIERRAIGAAVHLCIVSCSTLDRDIKLNSENGRTCNASRLMGQKLAELSKQKNITKIVFDRGPYLYHGRIKALADGARAGGLQF